MAVPTAVTIPAKAETSEAATASVPFIFAVAPTTPTTITWLPGDILIAWNTSVDTGYTVTISNKPQGKRTTITLTAEAIAFGAFRVYPRFPPQRDDLLTISASNAAVKFARLSTAAQPA